MSNLKRTQLYDLHTAADATMVDFGGWAAIAVQGPRSEAFLRAVTGCEFITVPGRNALIPFPPMAGPSG